MHTIFKIFTMSLVLLALITARPEAGELMDKQQAAKVEGYLELMDSGRYEEAWQSMSVLFKSMNDQKIWLKHKQAVREAYGPLTERQVRRASYRSRYRNAPDGEYAIIQFDSVFRNKSVGIETVVLQCDTEAECTVIEYIIN